MASLTTILYVDPNRGIAESLCAGLRGEFRVLAPVASLDALWEALEMVAVDVVLLEIPSGEGEGWDHLAQLRATFSGVRFLAFLALDGRQSERSALLAGAHGVCDKRQGLSDVVAAIYRVLIDGFPHLPLAVLLARQAELGLPLVGGPRVRSSRRDRVLWLLRSGYSQKDIAGLLEITLKDVEHHVRVLRHERGLHGSRERHDWVGEGLDLRSGRLLCGSAPRPAPRAPRPAPNVHRPPSDVRRPTSDEAA